MRQRSQPGRTPARQLSLPCPCWRSLSPRWSSPIRREPSPAGSTHRRDLCSCTFAGAGLGLPAESPVFPFSASAFALSRCSRVFFASSPSDCAHRAAGTPRLATSRANTTRWSFIVLFDYGMAASPLSRTQTKGMEHVKVAALVLVTLAAAEPAPSHAQTASAHPGGEDGLRVVLLGTQGGPAFSAQRLGISTLVLAGGERLLFDAGRCDERLVESRDQSGRCVEGVPDASPLRSRHLAA